jgi:hypothetical protein
MLAVAEPSRRDTSATGAMVDLAEADSSIEGSSFAGIEIEDADTANRQRRRPW